jgi:hypothetical protein
VARRRNLRRFMEHRKGDSASVYLGMLFAATPEEQRQTRTIYEQRLKQITSFNVSGGDGKKGVYSCAQFLTEDVPFLNHRGINRTVSAGSVASTARSSPQLEAVLVYRMPGASKEPVKDVR